ncbi:hypothetical protein FGO68_gene9778 [Halteria grandinella]|uniref:Uncharacterized protein n=1 Tax=Halteria grandinella TaxID=5974 RepID=A0A8J8NE63_HALGN|nr:hypothetical protein FGO68_gene9778 [Halteria grandinella]
MSPCHQSIHLVPVTRTRLKMRGLTQIHVKMKAMFVIQERAQQMQGEASIQQLIKILIPKLISRSCSLVSAQTAVVQ